MTWDMIPQNTIKGLFGEIMPSACVARAATSF